MAKKKKKVTSKYGKSGAKTAGAPGAGRMKDRKAASKRKAGTVSKPKAVKKGR